MYQLVIEVFELKSVGIYLKLCSSYISSDAAFGLSFERVAKRCNRVMNRLTINIYGLRVISDSLPGETRRSIRSYGFQLTLPIS